MKMPCGEDKNKDTVTVELLMVHSHKATGRQSLPNTALKTG